MKMYLLLIIALTGVSCNQQTRSNAELTDSIPVTTDNAKVTESVTIDSDQGQKTDQSTTSSSTTLFIDIESFTKNPFESDYPGMKKLLRDDNIAFNIIAGDTVHSEYRILEFDSSRIEFLDSDPSHQDELGDLICSADIRSTRFYFNQGVTIGMTKEDFLNQAGLTESSLHQDEKTGLTYYVNEIPFDDGSWKMTLWFDNNRLSRFQYKISPCYFEYDH